VPDDTWSAVATVADTIRTLPEFLLVLNAARPHDLGVYRAPQRLAGWSGAHPLSNSVRWASLIEGKENVYRHPAAA